MRAVPGQNDALFTEQSIYLERGLEQIRRNKPGRRNQNVDFLTAGEAPKLHSDLLQAENSSMSESSRLPLLSTSIYQLPKDTPPFQTPPPRPKHACYETLDRNENKSCISTLSDENTVWGIADAPYPRGQIKTSSCLKNGKSCQVSTQTDGLDLSRIVF